MSIVEKMFVVILKTASLLKEVRLIVEIKIMAPIGMGRHDCTCGVSDEVGIEMGYSQFRIAHVKPVALLPTRYLLLHLHDTWLPSEPSTSVAIRF